MRQRRGGQFAQQGNPEVVSQDKRDATHPTSSLKAFVDSFNVDSILRSRDAGKFNSLFGTARFEKGPRNDMFLEGCKRNLVQVVRDCLELGVDINRRQRPKNTTPLHTAAANGSIGVVKLLIDAKAMIFLEDVEGNTPIHYACRCGHVDIVNALLDAGANIECQTRIGETPLFKAVEFGHEKVVDQLLGRGCSKDCTLTVRGRLVHSN